MDINVLFARCYDLNFLVLGYDIGSVPAKSLCGCLTRRLKDFGMRWDKYNAEFVMALASIYYSNQWDKYCKSRHKATEPPEKNLTHGYA